MKKEAVQIDSSVNVVRAGELIAFRHSPGNVSDVTMWIAFGDEKKLIAHLKKTKEEEAAKGTYGGICHATVNGKKGDAESRTSSSAFDMCIGALLRQEDGTKEVLIYEDHLTEIPTSIKDLRKMFGVGSGRIRVKRSPKRIKAA